MASGNIKGITIEFNGDTTKLGKALGDVNKQIRDTDSALRDVDKALKLDPSNVELLAQKEELLNKQIEQTRDKLELQKIAAEEAAQALAEGTISQEEYAKLSAQVATTTSKLNELESQASGTSGELEATGEAAESAGDKAEQSGQSFVNWGEVVAGAAEVAWSAIQAVSEVIADTASALADMSVEAASFADDILTLSQTSGVAAETLQVLTYGEDLLDTSTSTVAGAITKLIRAMSNAEGSSASYNAMVDELNGQLEEGSITAEEYAEALQGSGNAFTQLGIDILDSNGNLRDSEEVFWEVIDALGQIENETEREALAMDLMGRSAKTLNPLIAAGSEGFAAIAEEARNAGYVMGEEALEGFHEFDDNLSRWDQGLVAAKRALGTILMPVLNDLATEGTSLLSEFTNGILDADGDIEQMGVVIDNAVAGISEILSGDLVGQIIEIGSTLVQTLAESVMNNLDTILQTGFDLLMTILQGIVDNLSSLAPVVADMVVTLANFIVNNLPTVITAAIEIVLAVIDGISRALPELLPAAVACVNAICEGLISNADELILAAVELIMALGLGLVASIPDLLDNIPTIAIAVRDELIDLVPTIAEAATTWGVDLIDSFISGIMSGMGRLVDSLENIASTVTQYIGFSVPERGPLHEWAYNNPGADMIDLFTEGMEDESGALQRSLYQTAGLIYNGMNNDYSGQLAGISSQLAGLAGTDGTYVFNINIGGQRFATQVVNAIDSENYLGGGL